MDDNSLNWFWPLDDLHKRDLYFYLPQIEGYCDGCRVSVAGHGSLVMLGGYSYLGLNGHPKINGAAEEAIAKYGTGTHGVRLLAGTLDLHQKLEARIAAFKRTEDAATFSSGYFTNVSTIACLVGRRDTVICDKLDHRALLTAVSFLKPGLLDFATTT